MTVLTPLYLQKKLIPARFDRQRMGDIFRKGVVQASDLVVTPNGATNVSVSKGAGYIPGTLQTDQGVYRLFNDAAFQITHSAPVTNPRMDTIIMRIQDSAENNNVGPDTGSLELVQGAESSTVTQYNRSGGVIDANLPGNSVAIADVIVRPGQAIAAADVIDRRLLALLKADPGDIKFAMRVSDPLGWKSSIGQAVSRVQYGDVLAQVTVARTGNTSNASPTISNLSTTADLASGMGVSGPNIPVGSYILTVVNGTSITLNVNASGTATGSLLTFYTSSSPSFQQSGTTTNATNTVTGLTSTSDMYIGMPLTASSGVPAGTYVASITSATAITMSANASSSGSRTLTFYPHGAGDNSGTFNLPDMRGRGLLGSGTAPTLTSRPSGSVGGEEGHTQSAAESGMPQHNHPPLAPGTAFYVYGPGVGLVNSTGGGGVEGTSVGTTGNAGPNSASSSHNVMSPYRAARPLIYTGVPF